MDVDRRGLGYLRGRGNKLSALMEMVHLRLADKYKYLLTSKEIQVRTRHIKGLVSLAVPNN